MPPALAARSRIGLYVFPDARLEIEPDRGRLGFATARPENGDERLNPCDRFSSGLWRARGAEQRLDSRDGPDSQRGRFCWSIALAELSRRASRGSH